MALRLTNHVKALLSSCGDRSLSSISLLLVGPNGPSPNFLLSHSSSERFATMSRSKKAFSSVTAIRDNPRTRFKRSILQKQRAVGPGHAHLMLSVLKTRVQYFFSFENASLTLIFVRATRYRYAESRLAVWRA